MTGASVEGMTINDAYNIWVSFTLIKYIIIEQKQTIGEKLKGKKIKQIGFSNFNI